MNIYLAEYSFFANAVRTIQKSVCNVKLLSHTCIDIPANLSANDFNEYFSSIGSETVAHLLKEYSSLQENPYNVRYIHTVLIIHI